MSFEWEAGKENGNRDQGKRVDNVVTCSACEVCFIVCRCLLRASHALAARMCASGSVCVCASSSAWCGVDVGDERVCGPQESWQRCRTGGLADRERRCRDVA